VFAFPDIGRVRGPVQYGWNEAGGAQCGLEDPHHRRMKRKQWLARHAERVEGTPEGGRRNFEAISRKDVERWERVFAASGLKLE
jgi:hypothetical protein